MHQDRLKWQENYSNLLKFFYSFKLGRSIVLSYLYIFLGISKENSGKFTKRRWNTRKFEESGRKSLEHRRYWQRGRRRDSANSD